MNTFEVTAETRTAVGTSPNRRLRREGKVPAVLFGAGKASENISVIEHKIRQQLQNEAFFSHILSVNVEGTETQAVLKAIQRDPTTAKVTHLDFLRVSASHEITMNVPLHFLNEDTAPGRKEGGVVSHMLVDIEISCLPKDLPEYIEVDMGALGIGDAIHLSEIKLPSGVELASAIDEDHDPSVAAILPPQKFDVEEEEAAEGAEGEVLAGAVPVAGEEAEGDDKEASAD